MRFQFSLKYCPPTHVENEDSCRGGSDPQGNVNRCFCACSRKRSAVFRCDRLLRGEVRCRLAIISGVGTSRSKMMEWAVGEVFVLEQLLQIGVWMPIISGAPFISPPRRPVSMLATPLSMLASPALFLAHALSSDLSPQSSIKSHAKRCSIVRPLLQRNRLSSELVMLRRSKLVVNLSG